VAIHKQTLLDPVGRWGWGEPEWENWERAASEEARGPKIEKKKKRVNFNVVTEDKIMVWCWEGLSGKEEPRKGGKNISMKGYMEEERDRRGRSRNGVLFYSLLSEKGGKIEKLEREGIIRSGTVKKGGKIRDQFPEKG